jgi:two-component system NtrC family sensor kinase
MMKWSSYRVRLPLSLAVVVTVTAAVLSVVIAYQTYVNINVEQRRTAQRLAHAMGPVLARAMKHDDVWLAFSLLRGPDRSDGGDQSTKSPALLLLDKTGRVFAANQPRRFPTGTKLADIDADLANSVTTPATGNSFQPWTRTSTLEMPVHSEDEVVGTLLVRPAEDAFWLRFREIALGGAWAILITLALFVPLGWMWGRRMVVPLTTLTDCMARIGHDDVTTLECPVLGDGEDEIGQLGKQFQLLLNDLKGKRALEEQIMAQDRLAAIGRVAAGVAHEINNPLGGLLTAIDTYRHRPVDLKHPDRTLDLIERGLNQIHAIVSALLVESRLESRALNPHDIEDVETLIRADSAAHYKTIHWASQITKDLPLPATPVRQILLNLVLNAVQFTPRDGRVEIGISADDQQFQLAVSNEGQPIAPEQLPHLFEPFYSERDGGTGLGLWVTYQAVTQLGGEISVESRDRYTRFEITLPLETGVVEISS